MRTIQKILKKETPETLLTDCRLQLDILFNYVTVYSSKDKQKAKIVIAPNSNHILVYCDALKELRLNYTKLKEKTGVEKELAINHLGFYLRGLITEAFAKKFPKKDSSHDDVVPAVFERLERFFFQEESQDLSSIITFPNNSSQKLLVEDEKKTEKLKIEAIPANAMSTTARDKNPISQEPTSVSNNTSNFSTNVSQGGNLLEKVEEKNAIENREKKEKEQIVSHFTKQFFHEEKKFRAQEDEFYKKQNGFLKRIFRFFNSKAFEKEKEDIEHKLKVFCKAKEKMIEKDLKGLLDKIKNYGSNTSIDDFQKEMQCIQKCLNFDFSSSSYQKELNNFRNFLKETAAEIYKSKQDEFGIINEQLDKIIKILFTANKYGQDDYKLLSNISSAFKEVALENQKQTESVKASKSSAGFFSYFRNPFGREKNNKKELDAFEKIIQGTENGNQSTAEKTTPANS